MIYPLRECPPSGLNRYALLLTEVVYAVIHLDNEYVWDTPLDTVLAYGGGYSCN